MQRTLFYLFGIASLLTVGYFLYSDSWRVHLGFLINRYTFNITETRRRAQEVPPYDCCANQSKCNDELLRIPKRLHQTYKTDQIPEQYVPLIRSWLDNHPDWEYYFWSDEEFKCLIHDVYPQYIDLYNKYTHPLQKSDAIRYFVLHRFGGVYADMDMRSLRPIEPFLSTNTCVIVPEPYVQTKLLFNYSSTITNCIMASTAFHPFLTYVLEGLQTANLDGKFPMNILQSTGPFFLNDTYYSYLKWHSNGSSFTPCNVYVADYKYLVPRYDKELQAFQFRHQCRSDNKDAPLRKQACDELTQTNFFNILPKDAYADHLWLHLGWHLRAKRKTQPIETIAPRVKRYGSCKIW